MDKIPDFHCDSAVSVTFACLDETSISVTGTVLGSSLPALLQINQSPFTSPVVLTEKLYFFKSDTNPSKLLGQIIQRLVEENINVVELHSTWNGTHGISVLKLDNDIKEGNKMLHVNGMLEISF